MLPLPFMKRWRKNGVLITSNFVVAYRFVLFVFLSSASLRYPLLLFILYPLPSYLNSSLLFSIPPSFLLYLCSSLSFSSLTPFPPHFSFIFFFSLSIPASFLLYLLLPVLFSFSILSSFLLYLLFPVLFFSLSSWLRWTRSHTTASRKMVIGLSAALFGNGSSNVFSQKRNSHWSAS